MLKLLLQRVLPALGLLVLLAILAAADVPVVSRLALVLLVGSVLAGLIWCLTLAYRAFLWKVSRRLLFSHFLIGVVPVPLAVILLLISAYMLLGFFIGHLHRVHVHDLERVLGVRVQQQLARLVQSGQSGPVEEGGLALAYYVDGTRIGGAPELPTSWPTWLTEPPAATELSSALDTARWVIGTDGTPTLAMAAVDGKVGVVAVYRNDLAEALRKQSGLWIELMPALSSTQGKYGLSIDTRNGVGLHFERASQASPQDAATPEEDPAPEPSPEELQRLAERDAFLSAQQQGRRWPATARIAWVDIQGPLYDLALGRTVEPIVLAEVHSSFGSAARTLLGSNTQINSVLWLMFLIVALLLFSLYAVAILIAAYLIFGLARAVNQLSRGTAAVQAGKFSVRIPTRRRDQIGALQTSFNEMSAHLEDLVARAAQKELLDKELAIAREVQRSLLPQRLPAIPEADFATLFEPSAALGGDYFDILDLSEGRVAVVIADVSGHGLSSGLRMSMLKAALTLLLPERTDSLALFGRLDELVRTTPDRRFFVTATLAIVDFRRETVELTNAGHPPTYRVRQGEVVEVVMPSSPLGSLGRRFASTTIDFQPGDTLVWLSDGLIEAQSPEGELYGYERMLSTLAVEAGSAEQMRQALMRSIESFTRGEAVGDDRTLVVLRYRPAAVAAPGSPSPFASSSSPK
jgi:serine phosphatase RsbU (regulator of sigma subunit)